MPWTAGTSRASIDHAGEWTRTFDVDLYSPDAVVGAPSYPGTARPGAVRPAGTTKTVTIRLSSSLEEQA